MLDDDLPDNPRGETLFRFRPEPAPRNYMNDILDEYIVTDIPEAGSGLIIWGRNDGDSRGWIANVSGRPVVRELLKRLEEAKRNP